MILIAVTLVYMVGWPWPAASAHTAALLLPYSTGQGEKVRWRSSQVKVKTRRLLTNITVMGKTDSTWGKLI